MRKGEWGGQETEAEPGTREWMRDTALHRQSYELRGPWLAQSGVCTSQSHSQPARCSEYLEKLLAPAFSESSPEGRIKMSKDIIASSLIEKFQLGGLCGCQMDMEGGQICAEADCNVPAAKIGI